MSAATRQDHRTDGPSLVEYLALVFALSVPFWVVGALVAPPPGVPMSLPVSSLSVVTPLLAAAILAFRRDGARGVAGLFRRALDPRRLRPRWLAATALLMPAVAVLTYALMAATGRPLPDPAIPLLTAPSLFVLFFLTALGEEMGWSGVAIDPMLNRWGALRASLLLGVVWAAWHVPLFLQQGNGLGYLAGQALVLVVTRVLFVWLYVNGGRSVLAAIVAHAMMNVSDTLFPNNGSAYDPVATLVVTVAIVALVSFLWSPRTLASWRFGLPRPAGGSRPTGLAA